MRPEEFLQVSAVAARLKKAMRHCWIEGERRESVADHCWRMTLMVMLIEHEPEFADIDMAKVMRMCLIHDLGEAFTGDIPVFDKTEADTATEDAAFSKWIATFPVGERQVWLDLLQEMNQCTSREAKTYKALDKLEAVISHNESDITTWLELEYELQQTYGQEYMGFSPYFMKLRELVDQWTRSKIAETE